MMEPSNERQEMSCSNIALLLEKELLEESLTVEERRAVAFHIDCCPECRDFVKLTSNLPLFADSLCERELFGAISTVMGRARERGLLNRPRRLPWRAAAAAASIAAATFIGAILLSHLTDESSETSLAIGCAAVAPSELVPGVFMTYCDGLEPGTIIEGDDVKVFLRSGSIGLLVDPERPGKHKVAVETPRGEVRVKGTVFAVHVEREVARVEVFRGVVEVFPAETGDAVDVSAGHGIDLAGGNAFALNARETGPLIERLKSLAEGEVAAGPHGGYRTLESPASEAPVEPSEAQERVDYEGSVEPGEPIDQRARHGSFRLPKYKSDSIDGLIQDAQSCLIVRDWKCAAAKYGEVLTRYPGRPESTAVLISLAKIELRHLGAPKDALAHYQSYQRRAPDGPLAEEAVFGTAEAYRRLGVAREEKSTLLEFIERYPTSSLVKKARARLSQLGR